MVLVDTAAGGYTDSITEGMRAILGGAAEQHEGGTGEKEPHILFDYRYGLCGIIMLGFVGSRQARPGWLIDGPFFVEQNLKSFVRACVFKHVRTSSVRAGFYQ